MWNNIWNEKGQTLLELIAVLAVGMIVVAALTFATIASLRNARFSQNQSQATKLAQEGIEKVRALRDRDGEMVTTITLPNSDPARTINKFSELWSVYLSKNHCNTPDLSDEDACFFRFDNSGLFGQTSQGSYEQILENNLERQILISDDSLNDTKAGQEKKVTVIVRWSDFSGSHNSRLSTILRKL